MKLKVVFLHALLSLAVPLVAMNGNDNTNGASNDTDLSTWSVISALQLSKNQATNKDLSIIATAQNNDTDVSVVVVSDNLPTRFSFEGYNYQEFVGSQGERHPLTLLNNGSGMLPLENLKTKVFALGVFNLIKKKSSIIEKSEDISEPRNGQLLPNNNIVVFKNYDDSSPTQAVYNFYNIDQKKVVKREKTALNTMGDYNPPAVYGSYDQKDIVVLSQYSLLDSGIAPFKVLFIKNNVISSLNEKFFMSMYAAQEPINRLSGFSSDGKYTVLSRSSYFSQASAQFPLVIIDNEKQKIVTNIYYQIDSGGFQQPSPLAISDDGKSVWLYGGSTSPGGSTPSTICCFKDIAYQINEEKIIEPTNTISFDGEAWDNSSRINCNVDGSKIAFMGLNSDGNVLSILKAKDPDLNNRQYYNNFSDDGGTTSTIMSVHFLNENNSNTETIVAQAGSVYKKYQKCAVLKTKKKKTLIL